MDAACLGRFRFVFGVAEAATVGLVAVWFAAGALAAAIPAAFGAPLWVQIAVFTAISLLSFAFTRPIALEVLKVKKTSTNADRVIGMTAVVTEEISNLQGTGRVQVNGQVWSARTLDEATAAAGEHVVVRQIVGVTLLVEREKA
jgi:membrane protein implicated in regulation of membrane protease activity